MTRAGMVRAGLALLLLLLVGVGWAGALDGPAVGWAVFSSGGAPASAGEVTLNGSLGQTAVGASSGGEVSCGAGFVYGQGGAELYRVYLPIVARNN